MDDKHTEESAYEDFINIRMWRALRALQINFQNQTLDKSGISLQEWRCLVNLARVGNVHLRELARLANLDATYTSRAALELESKHLIRRYDDPKDARRKRLEITDAGQNIVNEIWSRARELDKKIQAKIGKVRFRALKEALEMIKAIDHDRDKDDHR